MRDKCGIEVSEVKHKSPAQAAGIKAGDLLFSINKNKVSDIIDYMFHKNEPVLNFGIRRNAENLSLTVSSGEGEELGLNFKPLKVKTCRNNCIFCFVSQLPRGLRKTLYIKDEDYRLSFLYGNYITLTNLSAGDKNRIVAQRLSPLYISVHSADSSVRNSMLGNPGAPDILKELNFFRDKGIRMHTQIVMCPGYNDGKDMDKTIRALYKFYPYVLSIAVVPVGLTEHRRLKLRPVEKEDALHALELVHSHQKRFKKKHGDCIVYAADELYIKAGEHFPPLSNYGELPQIENGVGMVPLFISRGRKLLRSIQSPLQPAEKTYITFTGTSFYPYLKKFIEQLQEKAPFKITLVPIENSFFGKSVSVTGLLTGRDVIKALSDKTEGHKQLLIPDTVMREGDEIFLDNISRRDIEEVLGIKAKVIESTPEGLLKGIA